MPKRDDNLLLDDIYEAGNKILRYTKGIDFKVFSQNDEKIDAVIRNFEIIGEAAGNLSPFFVQSNTQIPWRRIVGYRNRLIHEYFGVDLFIVWKVIETELPHVMDFVKNSLGRDE